MAALFRQIGWREIDGDAFGGQGEARGVERGANPLARFGDGLVAEADERKADIAVGDLHLHIDRASLNTLEGHSRDPDNHPPSPSMRRWRSRKAKHIFGITQEQFRNMRDRRGSRASLALPCGDVGANRKSECPAWQLLRISGWSPPRELFQILLPRRRSFFSTSRSFC